MEKEKKRQNSKCRTSIDRSKVYTGKIVSLVKETIQYEEGKTKIFDLLLHPGAVVMIPIQENGDIVFVKQWRCAAKQILLELPAGTLEAEESISACAERELREEIGMRTANMISLGGFFTSPGFCTEYLHLFLAKKLTIDPLHGDDTEEIDPIAISLKEAKNSIEKGEIIDAKTIIGIYRYENWLQRQQKL